MKSQLRVRPASGVALVLVLASSLAVHGQTTNLVNDGTTIANLVRLQNQYGVGTPPAGLSLTPADGLLEASQTPEYSDFPLSGVWYDRRYSALSGRYEVQADVRPSVAYPEYVLGVMGWLDPGTGKGLTFRLVPAALAPFQVATTDFSAATGEDNDSVAGLYQLDGTPAVAGPGSAWASGGDYSPEATATLSLTVAPPTSAELGLVPGATARLAARVYQGGGQVGEPLELLTTLPIPTSHRFGYFAAWGTSLFPGELIGYLDNLRFVGELKIENLAPVIAITSPDDGSRFYVPQAVTVAVTATDPEGRLARVELYQGNTLVGTTNQPSAGFVISGLGVGSYAFKARAVDDLGAVGESPVVQVEMLPPQTPPRIENPQALPSTADFREFQFRATGLGGGSYRVEATTNLTAWTSVGTGAITGPAMDFTFPRGAAGGWLMYRVVVLP